MHERISVDNPLNPEAFFADFVNQTGAYSTEEITEAAVKSLQPLDAPTLQSFLEGFSDHLLISAEPEAKATAEKTFNHSEYWPIQWASILLQSQVLKTHADPRTTSYIYGGLGTNLQRWEDASKAIIARKEKEKADNQALV
jgi:hypothetical protein